MFTAFERNEDCNHSANDVLWYSMVATVIATMIILTIMQIIEHMTIITVIHT